MTKSSGINGRTGKDSGEDNIDNNNNQYKFKLFSYLSMSIIAVFGAIIIINIIQYSENLINTEQALKNQEILLQLLGKIEENIAINSIINTNRTFNIIEYNSNNSEKIDLILDYFNITYSVNVK